MFICLFSGIGCPLHAHYFVTQEATKLDASDTITALLRVKKVKKESS